ncbi:MAG TPA: hypothetical protein VEY12_11630 [Thermoplasmata archaeon]|nr:hypothetical protein [Thermoplasmata archaeon]
MNAPRSPGNPRREGDTDSNHESRPQSVLERQGSLAGYLVRRAQRRRERFLLRAQTTTLRSELLRALFLSGCIVLDLIVLPQAIFVLPGPAGWSATALGLVLMVWLEGRFYADHFALGSQAPSRP